MNKFIEENYSRQDLPQISAKVAEDGLGSYVATLECPFPKCGKVIKITRNGNRWNTSNFYKHINLHSQKQEASKKKNLTIDKVFDKLQEKNLNKINEATIEGNDERND